MTDIIHPHILKKILIVAIGKGMVAEVWIAEALVENLCPFLYSDSFK